MLYTLLYFLQQFAGGHLHAVEGEPLFAKVFDALPFRIHIYEQVPTV